MKKNSGWLRIAELAILINLVIECLSRKSIIGALGHVLTNPLIFLYNAFIIFTTLSVASILRRRKFYEGLISVFWILLAFVDFVLLHFRKTPFTIEDVRLLQESLIVAPDYIGILGIVGIIALVVGLIIGIVVGWFKLPKYTDSIPYKRNVSYIGVSVLIVLLSTEIGVQSGLLAKNFGNLSDAFKQYGFVYCFSSSVINRGISKPEEYSQDTIDKIVETVGNTEEVETEAAEEESPNVIFLQLESFMDPNLIIGTRYSQNPVPYFTYLKSNYPSGYLSVPVFGMGTVNTEFEMLTGMNLDDFGAGEYPYKTFLLKQTCETAAYNWKALGYKAHVVHNNTATFYSRNKVFPNMGFDTFTSIEYMNGYERTPNGWAKDNVLINEISGVLDSTEERDFVYGITVQSHGDYPNDIEDLDLDIAVGGYFDEENANGFQYYVNELSEVDTFIQELIEKLNSREEKTVVVMYGDHLPGLAFENDNLKNGDIYQTEYVIWSNFEIDAEDKDMEAYQLSAYVQELLGNSHGLIAQYHQNTEKTAEDYLSGLKLLEYDLLYGKQEAYANDGVSAYEASSLKMGFQIIKITSAYPFNDHICIEGENFTDCSIVYINDQKCSTQCVTGNMLVVDQMQLQSGDVIRVAQQTGDTILSTTRDYIYYKPK